MVRCSNNNNNNNSSHARFWRGMLISRTSFHTWSSGYVNFTWAALIVTCCSLIVWHVILQWHYFDLILVSHGWVRHPYCRLSTWLHVTQRTCDTRETVNCDLIWRNSFKYSVSGSSLSVSFMHHLEQNVVVYHKVFIGVLCDSQNGYRSFPLRTVNLLLIFAIATVFSARWELNFQYCWMEFEIHTSLQRYSARKGRK